MYFPKGGFPITSEKGYSLTQVTSLEGYNELKRSGFKKAVSKYPFATRVCLLGLLSKAILTAVWLISGGVGLDFQPKKLRLPFLAGVGFGLFFIFLHQGSSSSIFWTLVATRIASISSLLIFSVVTRQPWIPTRDSWLPIFISSLLDSAGNAFYALSARMGRMDVAAVLGSLYPGSTVLLAWFILKERISPLQMVGILIALAAIVLITL